ncbi:MAG TPA: amino acid-binding protein [Rhodospirillaceae bacterium]|nr:amino acid-binding protein [Rhodospirillaceae bacterium]
MHNVLVSVFCLDRTGLIAAISGHLFEIGANLADTSFAVLGAGAEFTSVCAIPDEISAEALKDSLSTLPDLADATVTVRAFSLAARQGPKANVTHLVSVSGGDRPGLIARLSEVFNQFDANIVRMDAQTVNDPDGSRYVTRFAVWIPAAGQTACLNTVANTAGELGLACACQEVTTVGG